MSSKDEKISSVIGPRIFSSWASEDSKYPQQVSCKPYELERLYKAEAAMCWSSHGRCSQNATCHHFCSCSFIHLSPFLLTISRRIVEARLPADGHVLVWSSLYFWYSFSTGNFLRRFLWMTLASGLAGTTLTRRRGSSGGGNIVTSMETMWSLEPIARETAHACV